MRLRSASVSSVVRSVVRISAIAGRRERQERHELKAEPALITQKTPLPQIDTIPFFMHGSCMATKTISLELDAYEKLKAAKRKGESFSAVVRRARLSEPPPTFADLREHMRKGGSGVDAKVLDEIEAAAASDRIPDNPWD